jgi:hypothetical protein
MNHSINHIRLENLNPIVSRSSIRKRLTELSACLLFLVILAGCASTDIVSVSQAAGEDLPRPSRILVYDFIANPTEIPKGSSLLALNASKKAPPMTTENKKLGKKLGASIAGALVTHIRDMGMSADTASSETKPNLNDIVLRGYIVSISQGSGVKRVVVGLGYGKSELMTVVEGYQMTDKGLRRLGSAKLNSGGNKTPGGGLGALTFIAGANPLGLIIGGGMKVYGEVSGSSKIEGRAKKTSKDIADLLRIRFKDRGWIK